MRLLVAAALAALGLAWACSPDLPDRSCSEPEDCFTQEICAEGRCVTAPTGEGSDDDDADLGLPDVASFETGDGGPDTGAVP